jgi:hypothetical protein
MAYLKDYQKKQGQIKEFECLLVQVMIKEPQGYDQGYQEQRDDKVQIYYVAECENS